MILILVVLSLLCLLTLIHRYRVRQRRLELLVMKRHVASYDQAVEHRLAG